ncbi:MAG: HNH endonuclease [Tolypothrix brevis GSE-NOS-MK-07-07A]|jgi:hypothetical protein|nr:HNH endonuclease [Tolypothrix brevis GSE-NOS-MK-07-07A]
MDFIQQAKNLGETVKEKVQETTGQIRTAIDETNQVTAEFIVSSNAAIESSIKVSQEATELINKTVLGISTVGIAIANDLKNLPTTAIELAQEMPKIATRLRYRAGVRLGDVPRTDSDVMKLFAKIPLTSKLGRDPQTTIRQFLADKHGSHIIPRAGGGVNGADNIVWEIGVDNIRRGANTMTGGELIYIRIYNAVDSILANSATIARMGLTTTGVAILTQVTITALSYSLDLYRGDITIEEYKKLIVDTATQAGITTPIVFLVLIAVMALFPEFMVVLSAPIVVAGFNALFGISIAAPIIQSILRHVKAGGFGSDVAESYSEIQQIAL